MTRWSAHFVFPFLFEADSSAHKNFFFLILAQKLSQPQYPEGGKGASERMVVSYSNRLHSTKWSVSFKWRKKKMRTNYKTVFWTVACTRWLTAFHSSLVISPATDKSNGVNQMAMVQVSLGYIKTQITIPLLAMLITQGAETAVVKSLNLIHCSGIWNVKGPILC